MHAMDKLRFDGGMTFLHDEFSGNGFVRLGGIMIFYLLLFVWLIFIVLLI